MRRLTGLGIGVLFAGAVWFDAVVAHRWMSTIAVLGGVLLALLGPTWLGHGGIGSGLRYPYRYRAVVGAALVVLSLQLWELGFEVTMIALACVGIALLTYRAPWIGRRLRTEHHRDLDG